MRAAILAILLLLPLSARAQTSTPPPATPSAAGATQPETRSPAISIQIDDEEMGRRIEEALDDSELEEKIEQHIDRILGQIDPSDWRGPVALALLPPILGIALMTLVGWWVYRRSQARLQARMDLHTQLLGKFNSGAEFTEFISSKGGQQFVESLWTPREGGRERILRSTRIGIIASSVGLGFMVFGTEGYGWLIGVITLAVGIGYLVSSAVTYRMSEKLGLLRADKDGSPGD